ncbi:methyl-accepting chemotaxis protein [Vibrio genomosp. F6]|uniref:methyl-accepting chemotaxis protein n=1 Tax=Vibrio genomosp. F6 TaxID=723172 RepID=UPI0010BD217F|nr:methyl-accepting chemotaxis protein [Vibrio genomosp. F6]TKF21772.1 methyl-accepting chemotaxis protein [Vibrio genomosp. F6]
MSIKQKLYLLGVIAILGVLSLLFATNSFVRTSNELTQAAKLVDKLEIRLLNLRRNEKDFLLRHDLKYLDKFSKNINIFLSLEDDLTSILTQQNLPSSSQLRQDILKYQAGFEKLVHAQTVLGLQEDTGLLGQFSQELESVESQATGDQLLNLIHFNTKVLHGEFDGSFLVGINSAQLRKNAQQLIAQKIVVGLKYNTGLLGDTRALSHAVEEQFKAFSKALTTESNSQTNSLNIIKNIISGSVLLIIILFIWQISRSINTQVQRLLLVIRRISETNDIGMRADLKGKDELVSVGLHFNTLLDKIEDLVSGSQEKSHQLTSSTNNMQGQLEEVIEQFNVQADHTTTMATAVQEMVATINEISESTTIAVEGVQQAASNAENGRVVVESTVTNIGQLSSTLSSSQQSIGSLNSHVDKIGGAVHIIQEIAEQTNLLALNAAIEAARAGEQGRGFAVVADEVRALASRTHQSTEEITNVVSAIQSQMSTVVADIEQCNTQGHETLAASEQLDNSLQQIINDMGSIQANSERIASAIEEQGIVMNQVSESITELNTISDNNMHSAQQCLTEVNTVSSQATEMDNAVAVFKTHK